MKCKYCQQELEEEVSLCPHCGGDLAAEEEPSQQEEVAVEEEAAAEEEVAAEEEAAVEEAEPAEEAPAEEPAAQEPVKKTGKKTWQIVLGVVAAVVLLAALAIVLLYAFGVDLRPRPNDINKKDTYTATADDKAVKAGSKVVATVNGKELTNGALQIYYKMMIADFVSQYGSYLSYMGLDYEAPLADQPCYYDENLSWEQYFLDAAIETWYNYQMVYMSSTEAGYVPSETIRASLDSLPEQLEQMAKEEEFESADAFVKDRFGPATTLEDYLDYCRAYYVGAEYINIEPAEEDIAAYYEEHEAEFEENEIDKASGNMVNVRHILIEPKGGVADDDTETIVYSDDEWATCLKEAEDLLQQWKDGDATEESFAELAVTYSTDGGSNTNGGLYTGITKTTSFVEPFLNWCMDEARQVGDTGIVKTDYGYHIMFFAYTQEQWHYYAKTYLLSDRATAQIDAAKAKWEMEVNYKNILLPALVLE